MNEALQAIRRNWVENAVRELSDSMMLSNPSFEDWAKCYGPTHVDHFMSVIKMIQAIDRTACVNRVLEIGAVPGYLTALLVKAGLSVSAVDLAPERAEDFFREVGVRCQKVNVETDRLPYEDASVDLVLFCEILEHLRLEPVHALRELARVLRPGGQALITTPQITPLMRWQFLWGVDYQGDIVDELKKIETIGHMGHFRLYSRREVTRMLDAVGLIPIRIMPGGRIHKNAGIASRLFRILAPAAMHAQLHYWATR